MSMIIGEIEGSGIWTDCAWCHQWVPLENGILVKHQRYKHDKAKRICRMSGKTLNENRRIWKKPVANNKNRDWPL